MLHFKNFSLVIDGSMDDDFVSDSLDLAVYYGASLQAVWAGTDLDGTLSLKVSNDNVTFSVLTGSEVTVSGDGDFMWDLTQTHAAYVQVVYTRVDGTGLLNVRVNGKTP